MEVVRNYTHPVLGTTGRGDACMLYVDQDDRRGNERVWVGVADSIGATRSEKYGAHNGWHAPGDGDVNDPVNFVRKHIGMPGTSWDMLGVKASESLNTNTGSIGSRGGASALSRSDPSNTQINGKSSRIGPSETMLNAYYKIMLMLTGDLNSGIFGPFTNKSQNDIKIMQDFLLSGSMTTTDRGFFGEGDGLVFHVAADQVGGQPAERDGRNGQDEPEGDREPRDRRPAGSPSSIHSGDRRDARNRPRTPNG